jgi:hypothetical protein
MFRGFGGALLGALVWSPGILIVVTLALYLFPVDAFGVNSPLRGLAVAFHQGPAIYALLIVAITLVVFALVVHESGTPEQANAQNYMDLSTRIERLSKLAEAFGTGPISDPTIAAAVTEIRAHLAGLQTLLRSGQTSATDTRWIAATGYIEAYRRLMRAEEAYIEASPDTNYAVRVGLHDWLRLKGSGLKDESILIKKLINALRVLSPANADALGTPENQTQSQPQGTQTPLKPLTPDAARADLREIDYAINEFRNDRYSGIVRARNKLGLTTVVFGLVAYALLSFAIAVLPAPESGQSHPILVGLALYLVGALSGLFGQLRIDVQADTAIDDYGLSVVRIAQTPLSSGLAAVLGVVIVKLAADTNVKLTDVFDLGLNPNGLLVAAALGLSPQVVIGRLTQQADKYKADLKKSAAGDGGKSEGTDKPAE